MRLPSLHRGLRSPAAEENALRADEAFAKLGILIGGGEVDGIDVFFAQFSDPDVGTRHWFVALDEEFKAGSPVSPGELVPGNPTPSRDDIAEEMRRRIGLPLDAKDGLVAIDQAFRGFHPKGTLVDFAMANFHAMLSRRADLREKLKDYVWKKNFKDVFGSRLGPLSARLGERSVSMSRAMGDEARARELMRPAGEVAKLATLRSNHPWIGEVVHLYPELDLGRPLESIVEEFAEANGLTPEKRVALDLSGREFTAERIYALRGVPLELFPGEGDREEWEAFDFACQVAGEVAFYADADPSALLNPGSDRWRDLAWNIVDEYVPIEDLPRRHHRRGFGEPRTGADPREGYDLPDILLTTRPAIRAATHAAANLGRALNERLPPGLDCHGFAWSALYEGRDIFEVLRVGREWDRAEAFAGGPFEQWSWTARIPDWKDPETGIEIVVLTDTAQLGWESGHAEDPNGMAGISAHLGHAPDLGREAATDMKRFLSLRRDGARVSVASVRLGERPVVLQHYGRRHERPVPDAERALADYVRLPAFVAASSIPARTAAAAAEEMGIELQTVEELMERWRPYLTERWRGATAEDLLHAAESAACSIEGDEPEEAGPARAGP